MTTRQLRQYEMLVRVTEFGITHQSRFTEGSAAGRAFATVADVVGRLSARAVVQLAMRRAHTRARAAARAALLEMLEAISRTATGIQAENPAFPNTFHLPERRAAHLVLAAGRKFARDLEPVAPAFIDSEMPGTLLTDLGRALDAYDQALRRLEVGKGEFAARRAIIDATLATGKAAARRLDAIVANRMRGDAGAIADWTRGRQVPRRDRDTAPDTPSAAAPEAEVTTSGGEATTTGAMEPVAPPSRVPNTRAA